MLRARVGYRPPEPTAAALGLVVAATAAAAAMRLGPAALALPAVVLIGLFLVRQPLALLILYLWTGLLKEEPIVQAVPVDVTLVLGALLAGVCFARFASGRVRSVPYALSLTLAVVGAALVAGLGWTPAPAYGGEKAWHFLTLTLVAVLAPFFLVEDQSDLRRYFTWTIVAAAFVALLALSRDPTEGRLEVGSADTIGTSSLLCSAALVLLLMGLARPAARVWATGAGIALVVIAAQVGSRGPLLSLGLALAIVAALWVMRVPRKLLPLLVAVAAGIAVIPFVSLPETSGARLSAATRDPLGALREDARSDLYEQAAGLIGEHPVRGAGTGAFAAVDPQLKWPHNLFLELWAELGLVPALLVAACIMALLASLFRLAWRLPRGQPRFLVYVVTGFFLFHFFSVQVSGDLNQNRAFWSVFGLASLVARHGVPERRHAPDQGSRP